MLRPVTPADRPVLIALAVAEDAAWCSATPVSAEEADALLDAHGSGVVAERAGRVVGYGAVNSGRAALLLIDPRLEPGEVLSELVGWLAPRSDGEIATYAADHARIAWLEAAGFAYRRSAFDLVRDDAASPAPVWPEGVTVARFHPADAERIHALVYVESGWTEIPGHHDRSLAAWQDALTSDSAWVAWRDGRPVGWISARAFPDGRGWIEQVAVASRARGAGLGRALLLHALADLRTHGVTTFALGVQGGNDRALGLYRGLGFAVEREFRVYAR